MNVQITVREGDQIHVRSPDRPGQRGRMQHFATGNLTPTALLSGSLTELTYRPNPRLVTLQSQHTDQIHVQSPYRVNLLTKSTSGHLTDVGNAGACSTLRPVAFRQDTYEPTKATTGHLTDLGSAGACSTLRLVTLLQQPYCPAALQSQLTDQINVWSPYIYTHVVSCDR